MKRRLEIDANRNAIPRVTTVVQVVAVVGVDDIHIIVVVPIVRPVFRPRVNHIEPKAVVLETRIPANYLQAIAGDAEPVIRTKVATVTVLRNAVAIVAAALVPIAVLGLPVMRAMLLPNGPLFAWLSIASLL